MPRVLLYGIDLEHLDTNARGTLHSYLTDAERHESATYALEVGRGRFEAFRGALRAILGWELRLAPQEVPIVRTKSGKPVLAAHGRAYGLPAPPVPFNLSHCGDLGLVAVARPAAPAAGGLQGSSGAAAEVYDGTGGAPGERPAVGDTVGEPLAAGRTGDRSHNRAEAGLRSVGVDIETVRPMPGARHIVEDFFHPEEAAYLDGILAAKHGTADSPEDGVGTPARASSRPEKGTANYESAFFGLWTQKEAIIKCAGGEVLPSLRSFSALGRTSGLLGTGDIFVVNVTEYMEAAGLPESVFAALAVTPPVAPQIHALRFSVDLLKTPAPRRSTDVGGTASQDRSG